jgi:hypothetical protein
VTHQEEAVAVAEIVAIEVASAAVVVVEEIVEEVPEETVVAEIAAVSAIEVVVATEATSEVALEATVAVIEVDFEATVAMIEADSEATVEADSEATVEADSEVTEAVAEAVAVAEEGHRSLLECFLAFTSESCCYQAARSANTELLLGPTKRHQLLMLVSPSLKTRRLPIPLPGWALSP